VLGPNALPPSLAGTASTDYSVEVDCLLPGGRCTGGVYRVDASVGDISGQGTGADCLARQGYAGQLYDVVGLALAASPTTVDEGATRQVSATAVLDDLTHLASLPAGVSWSVAGWPLQGVDTAGLVTAARVYAMTTGTVEAAGFACTGTLALVVLDVDDDDFDIYAADGLPDDWQVVHFGIGNTNAAPGADPDDDGQDNEFERVAGTAPTNRTDFFSLWIAHHDPRGDRTRDVLFEPRLADRVYRVLFSTNLLDGTWSNLVGFTVMDNGLRRIVVDTNAVEPVKHYRIGITLR
jgi:hypothetical protein